MFILCFFYTYSNICFTVLSLTNVAQTTGFTTFRVIRRIGPATGHGVEAAHGSESQGSSAASSIATSTSLTVVALASAEDSFAVVSFKAFLRILMSALACLSLASAASPSSAIVDGSASVLGTALGHDEPRLLGPSRVDRRAELRQHGILHSNQLCDRMLSLLLLAMSAVAASSASRGTVLVTGGSRGIGAACCKRLARDGYTVVVNYKSSQGEAVDVVGAIKQDGGDAARDRPGDAGDDGDPAEHDIRATGRFEF